MPVALRSARQSSTLPKSRSMSVADRAVRIPAAAAEVLEVDLVVLDAADGEREVDLQRADLGVDLVRGGEVDLAELRQDLVPLRHVALVELVVRLDRRAGDAVQLEQLGLELARRDLRPVERQGRHASLSVDSSTRAGAYRSVREPTLRAALVTGGTGRVGSAVAARLEADGFRVLAAGRRDGDLADAAAAPRRSSSAPPPSWAGSTSSSTPPRTASSRGPSRRSTRTTGTRAFGATAKGSFFLAQAAAPHLRASEPRPARPHRGRRRATSRGRRSRRTARPRRRRRC